jgi:hypothetical protein
MGCLVAAGPRHLLAAAAMVYQLLGRLGLAPYVPRARAMLSGRAAL